MVSDTRPVLFMSTLPIDGLIFIIWILNFGAMNLIIIDHRDSEIDLHM